jgi:hypothetical protein
VFVSSQWCAAVILTNTIRSLDTFGAVVLDDILAA